MTSQYSPFLPTGYALRDDELLSVSYEDVPIDRNGEEQLVKVEVLETVCSCELYVTEFTFAAFGLGFFTCYVGSRDTGYKKHPLPYTVLAKGAAFSQWFATLALPQPAKRERVRSYLLDCALPLVARAQELKRLEAAST
jgi:hypothetical protein